jgi:hypothetical protein
MRRLVCAKRIGFDWCGESDVTSGQRPGRISDSELREQLIVSSVVFEF